MSICDRLQWRDRVLCFRTRSLDAGTRSRRPAVAKVERYERSDRAFGGTAKYESESRDGIANLR